MAVDQPKNYFAPNKFKFTITGDRFFNNEFDIMCTGANVPGINLGLITRGTHIRQIELPGDSIEFGELNVEFILSENLEEYKVLYDWMKDLRNFSDHSFDPTLFADCSLVLLTNKNNPNIVFKMTGCFPYTLSEIPLTLNVVEGEPILGTCSMKFLDLEMSFDV